MARLNSQAIGRRPAGVDLAYSVSTVGLDEHQLRQYTQEQDKLQQAQNQGDLQ